MKLKEKVVIKGKLKVKTGLHIGGTKESFQIGGLDNPVIRIKRFDKNKSEPYIPGSSLKGKIRCLLERKHGKFKENGEPCGCGSCEICKLFGQHKPKKEEKIKSPTRLIFRDAYLAREVNDEQLKELTEIKTENVIDRIKGTAENPRQIERVVPGTEFDVEIIMNVYEGDDVERLLNMLKEGFELLQNDYLGGSGTRGYGKVDVSEIIGAIEQELKKLKE